jgi:hypothetical protein
MPRYRVEALKKFVVRTFYHVEAADEEEAEALCKVGEVTYDDRIIEEGDEEWIETGHSRGVRMRTPEKTA